MIEMVEKIVDGKKYKFGQFGARQSVKVLTKLSKIIGPSMASLAGAKSSILDTDINSEKFSQAVNLLCEKLDEDVMLDLIMQFMGQVVFVSEDKNEPGGLVANIFDSHFAGRTGHMIKVFKMALEVQYKDFFGVIADLQRK